jgi:hypothetical protein
MGLAIITDGDMGELFPLLGLTEDDHRVTFSYKRNAASRPRSPAESDHLSTDGICSLIDRLNDYALNISCRLRSLRRNRLKTTIYYQRGRSSVALLVASPSSRSLYSRFARAGNKLCF